MNVNRMLRLGAVLLFLGAWLTACGSKPVIKTRTVDVQVPVLTPLPAELTRVEPEPVLPAGEITNDDLVDLVERLRAWGRGMAGKLGKIAELQPKGAP